MVFSMPSDVPGRHIHPVAHRFPSSKDLTDMQTNPAVQLADFVGLVDRYGAAHRIRGAAENAEAPITVKLTILLLEVGNPFVKDAL
jgi:hypothetical protein